MLSISLSVGLSQTFPNNTKPFTTHQRNKRCLNPRPHLISTTSHKMPLLFIIDTLNPKNALLSNRLWLNFNQNGSIWFNLNIFSYSIFSFDFVFQFGIYWKCNEMKWIKLNKMFGENEYKVHPHPPQTTLARIKIAFLPLYSIRNGAIDRFAGTIGTLNAICWFCVTEYGLYFSIFSGF